MITVDSNNRYKAGLEVAKVHAQIKDARTDFLHKLTTVSYTHLTLPTTPYV